MRKAGVLMPVASLPSDYGIGELGSVCCQFVDFLKQCGIRIWQILPLNPLGYGNSPYQPYSSYAGDELYISLERLFEAGLLKEKPEPFEGAKDRIDYPAVREYKEEYLKKAFRNFVPDSDYEEFCSQEWVYPYAVFITFKKQNSLLCWNEWPKEYQDWIRDGSFDETIYEEEIRYEMFLQYTFFGQWMAVKRYANEAGIEIMGDIPFYVGIDSLDVWANQEDFLLGADGQPVFIAGVPPDYFSADGQRWGNPIYNWERLEKKKFSFWFNRLSYNSKLFDILRIDHFRAFDTYWKIPAECETAKTGEWVEAPGYEFFRQLKAAYPKMNIVVEDLGEMRKEVYELRDHFGFAGMKIVQFVFDPNEHNNDFDDRTNMLIYTGTHDNQTIRGWYESQNESIRNGTRLYLYSRGYQDPCISHCFIRYAFDSIADCAIVPVQDILGLGDEGRLNTPGTLGSPNWEWRLESLAPLLDRADFLKDCTAASGRSASGPEFIPRPAAESLGDMIKGALAIRFGEVPEVPSDAQLSAALLLTAEYLAARSGQPFDLRE
ncbi:MAG TPA: 4-alpha-glucanotransferase [Candidatus Caccomorpha excrementavium]|nr:4-alpha-glucanotransferase [Candidatus Caccomorpha excrementavium]